MLPFLARDDRLLGAASHDHIEAGFGMDTAFRGVGTDGLHGGADADLLLDGESGRDSVYGDGGKPLPLGVDGEGDDTIGGGPGIDGYGADNDDTRSSVERRRNCG